MRSGSWIHFEYQTLCDLFNAGVDVPEPVTINDRAILMEFVGDAGRAAPTLHEVGLSTDEAESLFDDVMRNITDMLEAGRVHGDLSAFNILYDRGRAVIIDLPQCVDPWRHPMAFELLSRDVDRVCGYFKRQGVACDAGRLTVDLWRRSRR
jgi:RIO kinase 1